MRISILGHAIDVITRAEAVEAIVALARRPGAHLVITANPEILEGADRDPAMSALLQKADLVTADGHGVLLAARLLGKSLPERVTGIDLVEDLARDGRLRLYFLGAKPGVARDAACRLSERYPQAQIVGHWHGYFKTHEAAVLADIRTARPDVLLCGLGAPAQEKWLDAHLAELEVPVGMGVGGSFDVLSGRVRRAPELWQNLRLEWAYRLLSDPRRWRRALALPRFVLKVLKERLAFAKRI